MEEVIPLFPIDSLDSQKKKEIVSRLELVAKKAFSEMDTSYAAAFSGVRRLIEQTKKTRRYEQFAVVFLTDGVTTKPYADEHRYLGEDIPIFTVGLNAASPKKPGYSHLRKSYDETILKRIAKESGGSFFQVDENIMHSIYSSIVKKVARHFEKIKIIKKKDQYLEQELIAISFDKIDSLPDLDIRARLSLFQSNKKKSLGTIKPFFYDRQKELILFSPRVSGRYQLRLDFLVGNKIIEAKTISFQVQKNHADYLLSTKSTEGNLFFFDVNPLGQQVHYLTLKEFSKEDSNKEAKKEAKSKNSSRHENRLENHLKNHLGEKVEREGAFDPRNFRFFLTNACELHAGKEDLETCLSIEKAITFESSLLFPNSQKVLPSYGGGSRRAIKFSPLREIPKTLSDQGKYAWHGYLLVEQPSGWFVHDVTVNYRLSENQPRYDLYSYEKKQQTNFSIDDFASVKQVGLSFFYNPWQLVKKYWSQIRNDFVLHLIANGLFAISFLIFIYLFYCFYSNHKRKKI